MSFRSLSKSLISLFFLTLVACSPTNDALKQDLQQAKITSIQGLNGDSLFPSNTCAANAFDLPSQGFRLRGSTGGLSMNSSLKHEAVAEAFQDTYASFIAGQALTNNVTLLVLDDFAQGVYQLGNDVFRQQASNNNSIEDLSKTVERLEAAGQLSHGALVMNHVNSVIESTNHYQGRQLTNNSILWQSAQQTITVKGINIASGRTTLEIANKLATELDAHSHAVINMSFVVLPCTVLQDFEASGYKSFEVYVTELSKQNKFNYDSMIKTLIDSVDSQNDPLLTLIFSSSRSQAQHVFVASAGNFGLNYPMYPARWPDVVSVTGSSFADRQSRRKDFFNAGSVMQLGAWFELTHLDALYGPLAHQADPIFYAGTSFSAPTVAVFSALDLAKAKPQCKQNGSSSQLTKPAETNNVWLDDAVKKYCY